MATHKLACLSKFQLQTDCGFSTYLLDAFSELPAIFLKHLQATAQKTEKVELLSVYLEKVFWSVNSAHKMPRVCGIDTVRPDKKTAHSTAYYLIEIERHVRVVVGNNSIPLVSEPRSLLFEVSKFKRREFVCASR